MAACLANAEKLLGQNPSDKSPEQLADLFCKNARQRIAANFSAAKKNHNKDFGKVAKTLMPETALPSLRCGAERIAGQKLAENILSPPVDQVGERELDSSR